MPCQPTTQEYRQTGSLFWPEFWYVDALVSLSKYFSLAMSIPYIDSDAMCWCGYMCMAQVVDMVSHPSHDLHAHSGLCRPLRPCTTSSRSEYDTSSIQTIGTHRVFRFSHRRHTEFVTRTHGVVCKVPATHRPLRQIESGQLLVDKCVNSRLIFAFRLLRVSISLFIWTDGRI